MPCRPPTPAGEAPRRPDRRAPGAALVLAILAPATPALAHDFWIAPASFRPAPGATVPLELRVGEGFSGDPVPRDPRRIVVFDAVGPRGVETAVAGVAGAHPAGILPVPETGLYLIAYESNAAAIELAAEKFEAYLGEEGLQRIVELRRARGESAAPGRERYARCAKALVRTVRTVRTGLPEASQEGGDDHFGHRFGMPLELVPEADPYRLQAGADFPVRLLFRGEPLAGALVVALPAADPGAALRARSDAEGRVRFPLDRKGAWLIKAVHMEAASAGTDADWESWWASLTFERP
jgi:hypothetical protein